MCQTVRRRIIQHESRRRTGGGQSLLKSVLCLFRRPAVAERPSENRKQGIRA
ncbi:hypothetical protein HMPREF9123_1212 [Neisseria bacilliformis ATCC BAA-1200]|uniref:Uncharacterized protein n=1 Tax=Neisseria bacilliformis ATCC BAA-1200 TaxID=888742 RepID=F2BBV7_9NEIS|nr:hypothetical protein HMPREF9123_1212 [Neisseria bacilliformis ATCC BAA-1200]